MEEGDGKIRVGVCRHLEAAAVSKEFQPFRRAYRGSGSVPRRPGSRGDSSVRYGRQRPGQPSRYACR